MVRELRQQLAESARRATPDCGHLVPFRATALGMFPYYWLDPATLTFNNLTLQWIASSLRPAASPIELDNARFTNYYIRALGSVAYSLSTADEAALAAAQRKVADRQRLVLLGWIDAFGTLPPSRPPLMPIDAILDIVATQWADPPTDLVTMQLTHDLRALLNRTPPPGEPVVPLVAAFLAGIGDVIGILNAATMNNGHVQTALRNVQSATIANGGLLTNDGTIHPAFEVLTPLDTILHELNDTSRCASVSFSVAPEDELFALKRADDERTAFRSMGAVNVDVSCGGMAHVHFGPKRFEVERGMSWFWMQPIVDAIANGSADVSGFHFSPMPLINFGDRGPFGFLTEVLISKLPILTVAMPHERAVSLDGTWSIRLLGVDLPPYAASSTRARSDGLTSVTFTEIERSPLDSRGWVHLVAPQFPAAV